MKQLGFLVTMSQSGDASLLCYVERHLCLVLLSAVTVNKLRVYVSCFRSMRYLTIMMFLSTYYLTIMVPVNALLNYYKWCSCQCIT